jgi:sugar phosphate permease
MSKRERQGWLIVASLFVTLCFVFGSGYNTSGVFFTPLLKYFKWSRAQLSTLTGVLAISAGLSAPLVGYLLDRVEARVLIIAGAVAAAVAFLLASRANSFAPMLGAYMLLGVGIGSATLLPCAMVIANWFGPRNRGIAMGITFTGTSLGGAVMVMIANQAIIRGGWRAGYVTLAIPMIVIVVPLVLLMVRTRPPGATGVTASIRESAVSIPGFELSEALRTRSFWLIASAQFFYATVAAGTNLHLITYLIGLNYSRDFAASMMGVVLVMAAVGKLGMGAFADRLSARLALALNFAIAMGSMFLVFNVSNHVMLYLFVTIFGLTVGAPLVLVPMLTVESLGLKRFGSIGGITGIHNTAGAAIGPIGAGKIFDLTHSYTLVFEIFLVLCALGSLSAMWCRSFDAEQAGMTPQAASAAS